VAPLRTKNSEFGVQDNREIKIFVHLKTTAGILLIMLSLMGCKITEITPSRKGQPATNIILMIGDGMGLSQITAAQYSQNKDLAILGMPVVGFHQTPSYNELITDSAAGATAFACGVKTYNGAIGMDSDTTPCYSILSELESLNYATGLIATSTIVHATPASFIAHRPMRVLYEEIAEDFLSEEVDLIIGGGKRYFDRRDNDERDLTEAFRERNYYVTSYLDQELSMARPSSKQNFVYFAADKHPLPKAAGRDYLPIATKIATSFLEARSKEGFFLMVEGSQIDWGGHSNDSGLIIQELLDFDQAVEAALSYAAKEGNTLVIVTADHECGGLSIMPGSKKKNLKTAFTTNGHTATMVPVFAFGPSSELFSGVYENTEIYFKMRKALQLDSISGVER
jgi:alkaline phosphatase